MHASTPGAALHVLKLRMALLQYDEKSEGYKKLAEVLNAWEEEHGGPEQ
jgi:hypothetical protein